MIMICYADDFLRELYCILTRIQEYGLTVQEKLTIGQGICTPLLKKIRADLQRNIEESEETVNRLNPR